MPKVYMVSDRAIQIDWNTELNIDSASAERHEPHEPHEPPEPPLAPSQLATFRLALTKKLHALDWPNFQCIQADQSLTVLFAGATDHGNSPVNANRVLELTGQLADLLGMPISHLLESTTAEQDHSRTHQVFVNYGGPAGQDLQWLAEQTGLSTEGVIELHSGAVYTVEFLGFLPGFAYLSGLPKALQFPRRSSPRPRVPAGTLAIGAHYCAVYPWESPGGWHLLGHVEQVLFNPAHTEEQGQSLFRAGDTVQFVRAQHA